MNSKKNHIKTNGLSLAMNTFISTSCGFAKRKRKKKIWKLSWTFWKNSPKKDKKIVKNSKPNLNKLVNAKNKYFSWESSHLDRPI